MSRNHPVYYGDYLQLHKILDAQAPESAKRGHAAHDETLFIIIHQTYELWFKQILHEIQAACQTFQKVPLAPQGMSFIVGRLQRVVEIQKILIDQLRVMETMTPLDFMDFRDDLTPASGFQSLQFRLLETALGITERHRMEVENQFFQSRLKPQDRAVLDEALKKPSLFNLMEAWLERMPFAQIEGWDFWALYAQAVDKMLDHDLDTIHHNQTLPEATRLMEEKNLEVTRTSFKTLLDVRSFEQEQGKGHIRLSQTAMLNALFIQLYRDWPVMNLPHQILTLLVDIDELMTTWRYRHAIMAQRLLGTKIGTGGSSGHDYLKRTTERNRVFTDLFNLATFLLPKSQIPELPMGLQKDMSFAYEL